VRISWRDYTANRCATSERHNGGKSTRREGHRRETHLHFEVVEVLPLEGRGSGRGGRGGAHGGPAENGERSNWRASFELDGTGSEAWRKRTVTMMRRRGSLLLFFILRGLERTVAELALQQPLLRFVLASEIITRLLESSNNPLPS